MVLAVGWTFTVVYCTTIVSFGIATLRWWSRELAAPAARLWGARALFALSGVRVVYENQLFGCMPMK